MVMDCARALLRATIEDVPPPRGACNDDDPIDASLQLICDVNRFEFSLRQAAAFHRQTRVTNSSSDNNILCDSIVTALEMGTDDVERRVANASSELDFIARRVRALTSAEETLHLRPSAGKETEASVERLIMNVNQVLLHECQFLIVPCEEAGRDALSIGCAIQTRCAIPLIAVLIYRAVLSRCAPYLETEVVLDMKGGDPHGAKRAWLSICSENWSTAECLLVNLSPDMDGTVQWLAPGGLLAHERASTVHRAGTSKPRTTTMVPITNPWAAVLRNVVDAQSSMCDCCRGQHDAQHPTAEFVRQLCSDLASDLEVRSLGGMRGRASDEGER